MPPLTVALWVAQVVAPKLRPKLLRFALAAVVAKAVMRSPLSRADREFAGNEYEASVCLVVPVVEAGVRLTAAVPTSWLA